MKIDQRKTSPVAPAQVLLQVHLLRSMCSGSPAGPSAQILLQVHLLRFTCSGSSHKDDVGPSAGSPLGPSGPLLSSSASPSCQPTVPTFQNHFKVDINKFSTSSMVSIALLSISENDWSWSRWLKTPGIFSQTQGFSTAGSAPKGPELLERFSFTFGGCRVGHLYFTVNSWDVVNVAFESKTQCIMGGPAWRTSEPAAHLHLPGGTWVAVRCLTWCCRMGWY